MKSQIQYLKEGVLIPSEWFKEFGPDISVQKCCNVIIIEPRHRVYARNKLKEMVEELRKSGEALPPPLTEEMRDIVDEVAIHLKRDNCHAR
jgi:hypothetical protein